jgi:predicted metal-dependent HD superfamily phosphohydrolase
MTKVKVKFQAFLTSSLNHDPSFYPKQKYLIRMRYEAFWIPKLAWRLAKGDIFRTAVEKKSVFFSTYLYVYLAH